MSRIAVIAILHTIHNKYMLHIVHIEHRLHILLIFVFPESLLNIMEDYCTKPSSWYAVGPGWMPVVDEDKSLRPGSGYDSAGDRNMSIHQEC